MTPTTPSGTLHALDHEPVRPHVTLDDLAHRIGQSGDGAQAGGHLADAGIVEPEPVDGRRLGAGASRLRDVGLVGRENFVRPGDELVGCRKERLVLGGAGGERHFPRGGHGAKPQLVHAGSRAADAGSWRIVQVR